MNIEKIVVLGTGGTIAGVLRKTGSKAYDSAQLSVDSLVSSLARPTDFTLECEQVAQVDSKDMGLAVWQALVRRVQAALAQEDVKGIVITHGTDTLEETAWLLQRLLAPSKPVVVTCAMRPADAPDADGPRNLADALTVAQAMAADQSAGGVVVVAAGRVIAARDVSKVHAQRLDAFSSGAAGDLATVRDGQVVWLRLADAQHPLDVQYLHAFLQARALPWVELCWGVADFRPGWMDVWLRARKSSHEWAGDLKAVVVAATGAATLHHQLEATLERMHREGVKIVLTTRCWQGVDESPSDTAWEFSSLSPLKVRIEQMLLLAPQAPTDFDASQQADTRSA